MSELAVKPWERLLTRRAASFYPENWLWECNGRLKIRNPLQNLTNAFLFVCVIVMFSYSEYSNIAKGTVDPGINCSCHISAIQNIMQPPLIQVISFTSHKTRLIWQ